MYATVASNGLHLVVWGLGQDPETAMEDALAQDFGGVEFQPDDFQTYPISDADAAKVEAGDVECEIVKGRVCISEANTLRGHGRGCRR